MKYWKKKSKLQRDTTLYQLNWQKLRSMTIPELWVVAAAGSGFPPGEGDVAWTAALAPHAPSPPFSPQHPNATAAQQEAQMQPPSVWWWETELQVKVAY